MLKWVTIAQSNVDLHVTRIDMGTPSFPILIYRFEELMTKQVFYVQQREEPDG